jgi:hypothetical protein
VLLTLVDGTADPCEHHRVTGGRGADIVSNVVSRKTGPGHPGFARERAIGYNIRALAPFSPL